MIRSRDYDADLAVVCNTTRCGGTYRVASTLCNEWSRRGHRVYLIALYDYESFFQLERSVERIDALAPQGVGRTARFRRRVEHRLLGALARLKRFYPVRSVDRLILSAGSFWLSHRVTPLQAAIQHTAAPVIVAFGWQANIITILACGGLGRKIVISERSDVAFQRLVYPWEELRCGLYNFADVVTANTRAALQAMQTFVDPHKLAFVPNPVVLPEFEDDEPSLTSIKPPVILIVANLMPGKAHDVVLKAFAGLAPELSKWRLAIVGGGEEERNLRKQAEALGIAERVDWHGRVADPFVFYRAASMFVLPSRYEGMPNALIEAMSCGLPVIVSNASPGPLDLVKDGETGLVVPVDDPLALADAMALLGNDSLLRKRLGDGGRRRVSEYESTRVMQVWDGVISGNPSVNQRNHQAGYFVGDH